MSAMTANLLIVFAKYPEPGMVKTRLARQIGPEAAALVYRTCARLVLDAVVPEGPQEYELILACWPADRAGATALWLDRNLQITCQQGEDLGSRMHHAFTAGFAGGHTKIIIIGTDCPALTREIIGQGFACLDRDEAVLGPAADGGYYLIGLRRAEAALFKNISWGTDRVAGQTMARLRASGMTCSLLPKLRDIDRMDDLDYYRRKGLHL